MIQNTSAISTLASLWIFASFTTMFSSLLLMSGMLPEAKSHVCILTEWFEHLSDTIASCYLWVRAMLLGPP